MSTFERATFQLPAYAPPDSTGTQPTRAERGADIALDPLTGDLRLSGDALSLVVDADYVAQVLVIRLKHFRNEWFRDQNAGTDWYGRVLGKSSDLSRRAELRARILSTPYVRALTRLDMSLDPRTRTLTVDFEVQLDDGEPLEASFEVSA